jgi:hypothetical protein
MQHVLVIGRRPLAVLDRPRRHVHRHRRAAPDGTLVTHKLLSENPRALSRRGRAGHPRAARPAAEAPIPADAIDAVKMGTTVATNALLERKGERTALVDHARLRRRAAHRLPEPAQALRCAASSSPRCCTSA